MTDNDVIEAARRAGERLGVPAAVLLAVAVVETNAKPFARFAGRSEPLIRFEGHYFDRLLPRTGREEARAQGLSHPKAGRVRNPASQSARWRLLDRAAAIDAEAAYASTSWGLGQVMGAHWKALGFPDARALAALARASVDGQFELAARFLKLSDLHHRLSRGDVAGFARGYNGPGFKRNRYDAKIAAALAQAGKLLARNDEPGGHLRRGSCGGDVAALQAALSRAGFPTIPDGAFGPATEAALRSFQRCEGLAATGVADAGTRAALFDPPGGGDTAPATPPVGRGHPLPRGNGLLSSLATWLSLLPSIRRGTRSF